MATHVPAAVYGLEVPAGDHLVPAVSLELVSSMFLVELTTVERGLSCNRMILMLLFQRTVFMVFVAPRHDGCH